MYLLIAIHSFNIVFFISIAGKLVKSLITPRVLTISKISRGVEGRQKKKPFKTKQDLDHF
jgi:hypothetical protein